MTVIQIVTLMIAIYGAVLATYTAVRAYFRDQPALKVKMSHSYGVGSMAGRAWLTVTVVNVGHRPVTICNPGFMLPDRARLFSPEEEARLGLPGKLAEGGSVDLRIAYEDVRSGLMQRGLREALLRPVCSDATGRNFIGKGQHVSVDRLS